TLAGVDVLVYDIQDVAARCFTYVTTLAEVMRAAAARRIPLAVLDRPDPLGPVAPDGPVLEARFTSFVGAAPVPLRYALTPGGRARRSSPAKTAPGCVSRSPIARGSVRSRWRSPCLPRSATAIGASSSSMIFTSTASPARTRSAGRSRPAMPPTRSSPHGGRP